MALLNRNPSSKLPDSLHIHYMMAQWLVNSDEIGRMDEPRYNPANVDPTFSPRKEFKQVVSTLF